MRETSKAIMRRLHDQRFATRYFVGDGIDIGPGDDSLFQHKEFFPRMLNIVDWEMTDGDAQYLEGLADETYDFVHSSHCLEHLQDPYIALRHWMRVLKPGGHMVVTIPDEDLYEQGTFPSRINPGHQWSFTCWKASSWSHKSVNLFELIASLGEAAQPLKLELLDLTYRYELPRLDQTLTVIGEAGIEFIVRKRPGSEINARGRLPNPNIQITEGGRRYYCAWGKWLHEPPPPEDTNDSQT